jgi:branched-chain amino acid transport system permease protein
MGFQLLQVIISGLQVGSIYALMALSFYVIHRATGILNFVQGEWVMVSAVLGVTLQPFLPYALVIFVSIAGTTTLSILIERLLIRPLETRNASLFMMILSLLGIMIVVRYGTGAWFGKEEYMLPAPMGSDVIEIGRDVFIQPQTLLIYATTAVVFIAIYIFTQHTWLGRSLRVAAIDPIGAALVGVDLKKVRTMAFGIGGFIAALVGWLYAPLYAAGYLIGIVPGIKGFVVMVIGGMASPLGSLAGGLALGLVEVAAARYLSSLYSEATAFVLLIAVLFARPEGLVVGKASA